MARHEAEPLLSVQGGDDSKPSFWRPLIYSLMAALGPLAFGYTLGLTSPMKDILEDPDKGLGISDEENSLFGSLVNVGAMCGAILGGTILDPLGRRRTMLLASIPLVAGFLMICFAEAFGLLLGGRILTGIGVGMVSLTVPVYIAEITPENLRGGMGSINQLAVTLGILVVYAIGMIMTSTRSDDEVDWRQLAWIGAIPPGLLGLLSFIMPASPRWLVRAQRLQDAQQSLQRLRGPHVDVLPELHEIEAIVEQERKQAENATFGEKVSDLIRTGRQPLIIAAVLMLFQQFSGINSVIFFSATIFENAGFSNSDTSALIVSIVQVVVTGISCLIIDKSGRRGLLMSAGIGMAAAGAVLGYFFYMKNDNAPVDGTVALVSALLYIACFSLGLGAIPWLMMSELFPAKIRGAAASFATLLNWSCSFLVTETFNNMTEHITEQGVFWFYGGVCALGTAFVLFFVPETKGRTLEEIERYFAGDKDAGNQSKDGAGTGGTLVKIATIAALLFVGLSVLLTSA